MFGIGSLFGGPQPQIEGYEHKFMSVDEMKASGALIVDIRTPPEWFQTGIIKGAKTVTFQDPDTFLAQIEPDLKDGQDVVLVCRSGSRTQAAGRHIAGRVSGTVISAEGGMIALVRGGYQPVPLR